MADVPLPALKAQVSAVLEHEVFISSSSSLYHFYVGSMWDDSRLRAARSYTSSPDSPFSLRSSFTTILLLLLPLLHLYPTSMWGRYGMIVASVQLGRTPPLLTVPSLSQIVSHADRPPLLHLYPTSMWGRCGTTVASVQLGRTPSLLTVPSLSDRLSQLFFFFFFLFFIFIPRLCGVDMG